MDFYHHQNILLSIFNNHGYKNISADRSGFKYCCRFTNDTIRVRYIIIASIEQLICIFKLQLKPYITSQLLFNAKGT